MTLNNRFLVMLGDFKSDQHFVEKTKLANNLYVENLNHLSWNKSPRNYVQRLISKITNGNNNFKFYLFIDAERILKWSRVFWKNKTHKQFVCQTLDLTWQYIYK